MTSVNRTKKEGTKEVPCLKFVAVYSNVGESIDRFDQRKQMYQIRRFVKCRIFSFLMDFAVINSFILWQVSKRNRSLDQLTFHVALARQLIDGYSSRKKEMTSCWLLSKEVCSSG
ncbi:piggyBac transposable element-derived protein 4 [Trichonephila clavipes]|uniref:PiggyBac transposable element-derived protein 4 n=1 Tax=Trichonephila clavipes TaxID=2585209 RepID=A0A8X6W919_TRICX|nr:piggyBac transposable element-derived protein 4 [Trichonephila clavipes]